MTNLQKFLHLKLDALRRLCLHLGILGPLRRKQVPNDARLAGLIDWLAIEDRTRELHYMPRWKDPSEIIETCAEQFHIDLWAGQKYRPEVWIEKDALVGVIEGVCNELDVPHFSCRGYTSQSEMWVGAMRLKKTANV